MRLLLAEDERSLSRAVTQAHRGKITAVSPDGKSLTVTVTLPT